jgi:hypothetical protein
MAHSVSDGALLEGVRGLAANWYAAGAAGLYFWNLGTPFEFTEGNELERTRAACYACLHEAGDPSTLRGRDKIFAVDNRASEVFPYYRLASGDPPLPITSKTLRLRSGVFGRLPLVVGDEVEAMAPARATLTMSLDDAAWKEALLLRLNGQELGPGEAQPARGGGSGCRLQYSIGVPPLRSGRNLVEIAARSVDLPERPVSIAAMKLDVAYD